MTRTFSYKMLLVSFFIALALGGILCQPALAETATVNTDGVNVRSGPGLSYEVIASLSKNTGVNVLQSKSGWSQVQWQQSTGWVSERYLNAAKDTTLQTALRVTAELANLRSGAGTTYPKVGEARKGDTLFLVKREGDWYQVKSPQGLAYINMSLVESASAAPPASPSSSNPTSNTAAADPAIKVYVNGSRVNFDVNPVIENGRTLVPMSAIFSAMGASVSWNGTNQTVTATKGTSKISLTIGASSAVIDGKIKGLDVPAKILNGRTLVPLAFVGSAFGGRVAWDPGKRQVEIFCPPDPGNSLFAIVIDEDGVNLREGPSPSSTAIATVARGQQFGVITEDNGWYQVYYMGTRAWVAGWLISPVWSSGSSSTNSTSGGTSTANQPSGTTTQTPGSTAKPSDSITANPAASGRELTISYNKDSSGINLVITHPAASRVQISEKTGSITYNFSDCALKAEYSAREDQTSLSISGKNSGQGVQVQITMPSGMAYTKSSGATSQTLRIYNYITAVNRSTFNVSGENITVKTAFGHSFSQQQNGDTMVLRLPGTAKGLAQKSYSYSSQSLQAINVEQQTDASGIPTTIITIRTKAAAKFSIGSTDENQVLHILFINTRDIPPRNSVVVLDPGHGGSEVGACGAYTQEKDINLAIALKVGAILTQKGIRVEYTRKTDNTVALGDRGPIANLLNAALFVSIHCNAVENSEAQGTETWFWAPASNPGLYIQKDEREKLATAIQDRLAAALGRPNRGVKSYQNLCVLRTSEMPSALTEVAFLSNPEEEKLLNQDSFQNLAAKAIAEGIAACMPKK